jgi:hypothetical protein
MIYDGLILTVGMQAAPVVYSIKRCEARYVAFICTPESERQTLGTIVDPAQLSAARWRNYVVGDEPAQIGRLCLEFHQAFRWLQDTCGLLHHPQGPTGWWARQRTLASGRSRLPSRQAGHCRKPRWSIVFGGVTMTIKPLH